LLKELYPKKPRELSPKEEEELEKTIKYSGNKLFDAFNQAKSIWNLAYDNVNITLRKNKSNVGYGKGYLFYYRKSDDKILVWEYDIRKIKGDEINSKTYLNLIFEDSPIDLTLPTILDNFSTWNSKPYYQDLPVFEMKNTQDFPMEATLIPIVKRKIMAYVYQVVNFEKIKNFDSEI
jgi:hypothetical protein